MFVVNANGAPCTSAQQQQQQQQARREAALQLSDDLR